MPIYEYECTACKTRFERSQRFSDPPITECPECGGRVRRVLFPAGIVFKGSGWYATDSRTSAPSDSSASASTSSNGSTATEGKAGEAASTGAAAAKAAKTDSARSGSAASDASKSP